MGYGDYRTGGNQLHISVAKNLFDADMSEFDFKWVDNSDNAGDIAKFMSLGDAAPDSRFNFRYTTDESEMTFDAEAKALLDSGAVVMAINKNRAYVGAERVKIDKGNTSIKPQVIDGTTYVPMRFFGEALGKYVEYNDKKAEAYVGVGNSQIKVNLKNGKIFFGGAEVEGCTAILDGDRVYLPLRTLAELLGAEIAWDNRGIIVVGAGETVDTAIFDEFYRKM